MAQGQKLIQPNIDDSRSYNVNTLSRSFIVGMTQGHVIGTVQGHILLVQLKVILVY